MAHHARSRLHAGRHPVVLAMVLAAGCFTAALGCGGDDDALMLYTSVDAPVIRAAEPGIEERLGSAIDVKTDTELEKTVGLANLLRSERSAPRADVFWSSECVLVHQLVAEGVLHAPVHEGAARPRVWVVRQSWLDEDPQRAAWLQNDARFAAAGAADAPIADARLAMADPLFGTTFTHTVALYQAWGEAATEAWLARLQDAGLVPAGGNRQVVDAVAAGRADIGFTDPDDILGAQAEGNGDLAMVLPLDTVWLPSTAAMVTGAPHEELAGQFLAILAEGSPLATEPGWYSPTARQETGVAGLSIDWPAAIAIADQVRSALQRRFSE